MEDLNDNTFKILKIHVQMHLQAEKLYFKMLHLEAKMLE